MAPGSALLADDAETLDSLLHALTRSEERRLLDDLELVEEEAPLDERDEAWPDCPPERVAWPLRS